MQEQTKSNLGRAMRGPTFEWDETDAMEVRPNERFVRSRRGCNHGDPLQRRNARPALQRVFHTLVPLGRSVELLFGSVNAAWVNAITWRFHDVTAGLVCCR